VESVRTKRSADLLSSEEKILIVLMLGKIDSTGYNSTRQNRVF
jgi:hypothetical protein